jgi:hypothetical protein
MLRDTNSDAVGPNEFLGDHVFWHRAQLTKEGTRLKLDVHATCEANIIFADQSALVNTEGELWLSTAIFKAAKGVVSNFLSESQ